MLRGFSRVQGTHIHFDCHSRSAEDYKVYLLHCYLLAFSVASWLSRTLCFFKEVKASLRMLWERNWVRMTFHDWQEFQLAHYDYTLHHRLCYYLCSETVRQHHCTNRCTKERFIRSGERLGVLPRNRRLLFPLSPEIQEIFSFVDVLNCERCI